MKAKYLYLLLIFTAGCANIRRKHAEYPAPPGVSQWAVFSKVGAAYDAVPLLSWESKTKTLAWTYAAASPDGFKVEAYRHGVLEQAWILGPVSAKTVPLPDDFWMFYVTARHGQQWGKRSEGLLVAIGTVLIQPQAAPTPNGPWTNGPVVEWPNVNPTNTFFRLELLTKP